MRINPRRLVVGFYCAVAAVVISFVAAALANAFDMGFKAHGPSSFFAGMVLGIAFAPCLIRMDPAKPPPRPLVTAGAAVACALLAWPLCAVFTMLVARIVYNNTAGSIWKDLTWFVYGYWFVGFLGPGGWLVSAAVVMAALLLAGWDARSRKVIIGSFAGLLLITLAGVAARFFAAKHGI